MHLLTEAKKIATTKKLTAAKSDAYVISEKPRETDWYVITGGPGSGKTTTVNLLAAKGYKTTIEHARHYIDTQLIKGRTVEEVRKNQTEFQLGILQMQIEQEASLDPNEIVFLDRAIPDALAYYRFLKLPIDERLTDSIGGISYKKVFMLDTLPIVNDYARREDEKDQKRIHGMPVVIYKYLPFLVVHVLVLPLEERVNFILKNL